MFGYGCSRADADPVDRARVVRRLEDPELGRSLGQAIREFKRGVETPDAPAEPKAESGPGPDGPKSA